MSILKLTDVDIENKRVLIREDLNVPIEDGKITSEARLLAALPTLEYCLQKNARVMVMSHLGRPKEGVITSEYSLAPIADYLAHMLGQPVRFITDWLNGIEIKDGEIVLLENVRFHVGEKSNDPLLAQQMARLCDVFVMDAFATAHRAEASTTGISEFAPVACAGPLLLKELDALEKALANPKRPLLAIVGGSKVSSKLCVLESLIAQVDQLIVGGGIANTFLVAAGFPVGKSLYEPDLVEKARELLKLAETRGAEIPLPVDVMVATNFSKEADPRHKKASEVSPDEMILDIGPETAQLFASYAEKAHTILWNGPVGVFEWDSFSLGTQTLAQTIAQSSAFSIAGGGDTLAAIEKYQIADKISYISTGGGAFLEFLEGKKLPALVALASAKSGETDHVT